MRWCKISNSFWGKGHSILRLCIYHLFGVKKIPWGRKWQPAPVLLPGKFHGQRSLAGFSLWNHKSQTGLKVKVKVKLKSLSPVQLFATRGL